ncbi:MAG: PD-(D/E)XK nuclease family protein [Kosmotogaceae bacterium]
MGGYGVRLVVGEISEKQTGNEDKTIISDLISEELEKKREEEKRTLYVSTTRPREMLILSLNGKPAGKRPWSQMFLETLINYDEKELQLVPDMEDIVEEIEPGTIQKKYRKEETIEPPSDFDIELVKSLDSSTYNEYISPTALMEEIDFQLDYNHDPFEFKRDPKELGTLAHSFLEQVGKDGTTLRSLLCGGNPVSIDRIRFTEDDLRTVKKILEKNIDNRLIQEIEESKQIKNENMFQKKFGKYILVGVIDKLYMTQKGWKIADFKFAHYDSIKLSKHKFQMQFYYYVLKELINPVEINLLYLKDSKVIKIEPDENFKKHLEDILNREEEKVIK